MRSEHIGIVLIILSLLAAGGAGRAVAQERLNPEQFPAGVVPLANLPGQRAVDYSFDEIDVQDVERWLSWARVELPVAVTGKLSGWLWVQPGGGWLDFSNYRVEGEVTSDALEIEQWQIAGASVRFGYAEGQWYIGRLGGSISAPDIEGVIGEASLSAKLPTEEPRLLQIDGSLARVDLKRLLRSLGVELEVHSGSGDLQVVAAVPWAAASDLQRWKVTADLQMQQVALATAPPVDLDTQLQLEEGRWELSSGAARVAEQDIRLAGHGRLDSDYPFALQISGAQVSLRRLLEELQLEEVAQRLQSEAALRAEFEGDFLEGVRTASIELASERLQWDSMVLEQIVMQLDYLPQGIQLTIDSAELAGGSLAAVARWDGLSEFAEGLPQSAELQLSQVDLPALLASTFDRAVSSDLAAISDGAASSDGVGGATSGQLRFARTSPEEGEDVQSWSLTGDLRVADQGVRLAGRGRLDPAYPFAFQVSAPQVSLQRLLEELQFEDVAQRFRSEAAVRAEFGGDSIEGIQTASIELTSERLQWDSTVLEQVALQLDFLQQGIRLTIESAELAGGSLQAVAHWDGLPEFSKGLPQSADLQLSGIGLRALVESTREPPVWTEGITGTASGRLQFSHGVAEDGEETLPWSLTGELNATELIAGDVAFGNVGVELTKALQSEQLVATLLSEDRRIAAELHLALEDAAAVELWHTRLASYRATGQVKQFVTRIPLSEAKSLPLRMTGVFDISGEPNDWLQRGLVELEQAEVHLASERIRLQTAVLQVTPAEFRLQRFQLVDSGGRVAGSGVLRRQPSGEHQLNLKLVRAQLSPYLDQFAPEDLRGIEALIDLETRLRKSAESGDMWNGWAGTLEGVIQEMSYRGTPLGHLGLEGTIDGEQLSFALDGELLGSSTQAKGNFPLAALDLPPFAAPAAPAAPGLIKSEPMALATGVEATNVPVPTPEASASGSQNEAFLSGHAAPLASAADVDSQVVTDGDSGTDVGGQFEAQVNGLRIDRMVAIISSPREAYRYRGVASFKLEAEAGQSQDWAMNLQLEIPKMTFDRRPLVDNFQAQLTYVQGAVAIQRLSGGVAGGRVTTAGGLQLAADTFEPSGNLRFDAQQVDVASFLALLTPGGVDDLAGVIDYRGSARIGREIRLSGSARLRDALVFGFPLQDIRGRMDTTLDSLGGFRLLSAPQLSGRALGGNYHGGLVIRGGSRTQIDTSGRISRGKLDQLSRALGFEHIIGTGMFLGSFQLSSADIASLPALRGQLQIDFDSGDAQSVPVLADLSRLVPGLQLASADITGGTMHALIGSGQLRILDLFLNSDAFWLAATGNASLSGGALDLEAILQTGGGINEQLTDEALRRLVESSLPTLALLTELNDWLRNRTLYFRIGGTTNHPVIQTRAAPTLARALLQNVRRQLLLPAATQDRR